MTKTVYYKSKKPEKDKIQVDVTNLVLWRSPVKTLYYAFMEILTLVKSFGSQCLSKKRIAAILLTVAVVCALNYYEGPHQQVLFEIQKYVCWSFYWIWLGVLSSAGFGFGLHTFVLYLAPHVVAVTLAANECGNVNFSEPPYPEKIICTPGLTEVTPFVILKKVILECFMWGVGTAVGELTTYFLARSCRQTGQVNEELAEVEDIIKNKKNSEMTLKDKGKVLAHNIVSKFGFCGILVFASIPNPLFDLAGLTCGAVGVPFWTFFGATLIGKAVVKAPLQTLFVIFAFSEEYFLKVLVLIKKIPYVGDVIENFLLEQKQSYRQPTLNEKEGWFSKCFENVILVIVVWFAISVVNQLAQNYKSRSKMSVSKKKSQ